MKTTTISLPIAILSVLSLVAGCSAGREVEVTGEAKAAASVTLSGPISIAFTEPAAEGEEAAEAASLKTIELAAPGEFKEMVDVEGDKVHVFALNDANKDGACSDGEPWAEADALVKEDGTVDRITLELSTAPCPKPAGQE